MGERSDEIKEQIDQTRENLNDNLIELQEKVKSVFDWRTQFDERPMTMLAVAFGGGLLASALIFSGGSYRRREHRERQDSSDSSDQSRYADQAPILHSAHSDGDSRYHALKGALMTVIATRLGGVVGDVLSGYRDELRRMRQNRGAA